MSDSQIAAELNEKITAELKEMNLLLKITNIELKSIKGWITLIAVLPIIGIAIGIFVVIINVV